MRVTERRGIPRCNDGRVSTNIAQFLDLVMQLPDVQRSDNQRYSKFEIRSRTFGYLWEPTRTVGLKQTLAEQIALVDERGDWLPQ